MANHISLSVGLKTVFTVLGILMAATLIYTTCNYGNPFKQNLTPWLIATNIDFIINAVCLAAWVVYKEANWVISAVWTVFLICIGGTKVGIGHTIQLVHFKSLAASFDERTTTCAYIVLQFSKLSSQESSQDPIYYVLLRHLKKDDTVENRHSSVVALRILFTALGCLMLGILIYTLLTDGSPFRKDLLTPWMVATLIDFYINVVALLVWVVYKESSWISSIFWAVLLICFGSIATCFYVVWKLFQISSQDPAYHVLFRQNNRAGNMYKTVSGTGNTF